MQFSFQGLGAEERFAWFRSGLQLVLEEKGHRFVPGADQASLLFNFSDPKRPAAQGRRADSFAVAVTVFLPPFDDPIQTGYPLLVRSFSNLLIVLVAGDHPIPDAHFLTPEQGYYLVKGNQPSESYFRTVYDRISPLATSRRVVNNIFETDLEEKLWEGDDASASISWAGKRLGELGLLPSPFPLDEHLNEAEQQRFRDLFGVGGLSYGNLSARLDEDRFWMSASGVDKSDLHEIGRDILLVKGFDANRNAMVLSVPPHVDPRRVSVDAIEHWMVYREHPEISAILHVHAWMDGVPCTEFNYPCGTQELGTAVAALVRMSAVPKEAVVGLKNHGLTIAGVSLPEILGRVGKKLYQPVPMF